NPARNNRWVGERPRPWPEVHCNSTDGVQPTRAHDVDGRAILSRISLVPLISLVAFVPLVALLSLRTWRPRRALLTWRSRRPRRSRRAGRPLTRDDHQRQAQQHRQPAHDHLLCGTG